MRRVAGFQLRRQLPSSASTQIDVAAAGGSEESLWARLRFARALVVTLAICAAVGGLIWSFDRPSAAESSQAITLSEAAKDPPPRLGSPAPSFQLKDLGGQPVDLESFRGRPVWITFWASWCPPCRAESPEIKAAYERHANSGLVILAIDVGEDPGTVGDYVAKAGLPFVVGLDRTTAVAAMYRVRGLPTHFFVDVDGVLREVKIGPMGNKEIERRLGSLIGSTPMTPRRAPGADGHVWYNPVVPRAGVAQW